MTETEKINYICRLEKFIEAKKAWGAAVNEFIAGAVPVCENNHEPTGIHIFNGIEKLAEAVGEKLCREKLCCEDYDSEFIKISFQYKGFKVFQLERQ